MVPRPGTSRQAVCWPGRPRVRSSWRRASRRALGGGDDLPVLFKVDDEGFPVVQAEELNTDDLVLEAQQAAEVCPVSAITIED